MPLKTTVKVSNISNLSDARYCAGMGVEMLGFGVIPDTDDYMPPEVFQDIRGWVAGPKIIAELYGINDPGQIAAVVRTYAPDYFELSLDEYRNCKQFLHLPSLVYLPDVSVIKSLELDDKVAYVLIDEHASCIGIEASGIPALKKIASLPALHESLDEGCYSGIVLQAPREARVGITNYEQLGTILEALEEEY